MNTEKDTQKIKRIVLTLTIVCLLLVLSFMIYPDFFKNRLETEIFKLTYQFLLLTVVGGAVVLLFSLYTKIRDEKLKHKEQEALKAKEEKTLQRKFYHEIIQAYNDIKKIRRFFRARVRMLSVEHSNHEHILIKTSRYDELMKELTILQLKCEFFCEEVKSNRRLYSTGDTDSLYFNLQKLEKYLNHIVNEYENCFKHFPNQSLIDEVHFIPLNKLEKLREFINKYEDATDFQEFKKAAETVSGNLLKILTSSNTE